MSSETPVGKKTRRHRRVILLVLLIAVLLVSWFVFDNHQLPANQLSARLFIATVHAYQRYASPSLTGFVHCRFRPTCSHYSIEAVQRHGIVQGLLLTVRRLRRCTNSVPDATYDPIP